ncbi:HEAT repeat domain-containing protein [Gemmata sp. JC717]|uniref:HEAT repeat domain-containing protein n=1 Tax=Gemmata algarum TaxID=2975278 RepID=UPI0021BB6E4B|nr:HEAT repeat domain-containing protein [Gemmata algarum]MDY3555988.1 HEAT repeat domain-containing protein [Gemmata algarum]
MNRPFRPVGVAALAAVLAVAAPEAAAQDRSAPAPNALERRSRVTDEELRKQLLLVPEVGLDQPGASALYAPLVKGSARADPALDYGRAAYTRMALQIRRPDLLALPWVGAADAALGRDRAEELHAPSAKLRAALRASAPRGDVVPDPAKLRERLADKEWTAPAAVPALTQALQAEGAPVRLLLVERLAGITGPEASQALAQRAVFDLAPEVRERAARALADRPAGEYAPELYRAFRYPWAPAADHAAEALVALRKADLVPELVERLRDPDPNRPYKPEPPAGAGRAKATGYVRRELVRVNHLCNCMVCHAPSQSKDDLVRGRVPQPGEDAPPRDYQTGLFVRADVTFLRPDFAVVQPVERPGKWAGNQRYDYLVRTRPLAAQESAAFQRQEREDQLPRTWPQREAVLFALRHLTGWDHGATYEQWAAGLRKGRAPQPPR